MMSDVKKPFDGPATAKRLARELGEALGDAAEVRTDHIFNEVVMVRLLHAKVSGAVGYASVSVRVEQGRCDTVGLAVTRLAERLAENSFAAGQENARKPLRKALQGLGMKVEKHLREEE